MPHALLMEIIDADTRLEEVNKSLHLWELLSFLQITGEITVFSVLSDQIVVLAVFECGIQSEYVRVLEAFMKLDFFSQFFLGGMLQ